MTNKLLIITAGTVAASVGQELLRQMKSHMSSNLQVMVRYIDTAYLPNRYGNLRNGEWFQMNIGQRYMDAIYKRIKEFPRIEAMLFPGLLPGTAVTGGGSIRYNGAGAVEVQRDYLQRWLSGSMAELAQSGNSETNISMALIISAVGATGSGSIEHLIEVIVDAAYHAKIKSTTQSNIRCDVYILQPGRQDVTELGLANTLSLYAELASSQLTLRPSTGRQYQGRKIMIDWGSTLALSSINQLIEAAATLVRLSSDSSSSFSAEFQEREVDNHVLRELDPISSLPMHLSTATVVTISLGNLMEQVAQRDAAQLIESLVFGKTTDSTTNVFISGNISQALSGESGAARYKKLLEYLLGENIRRKMGNLDRTAASTDSSASEKLARLQTLYHELQSDIRQSKRLVQNEGQAFIDRALNDIENTKYKLISSDGLSLSELREGYNALENTVGAVLEEARKDVDTTKVRDEAINNQVRDLQSAWPRNVFGYQERLQRLVSTMKRDLQGRLAEIARDTALYVLEELKGHCSRAKLNLDVVLEKLRKEQSNREGWAAAYRDYNIETGNPLYLMALSTPEEIKAYTEKVSIFSARKTRPGSPGTDQIVGFRKWLEGNMELFDALFEGEVERLTEVATSYTSEKVLEEVSDKRKVVDILLEAGEKVLVQRLKEAAGKAVSLVSYDSDFAPDRREVWHISADFGGSQVKREKLQKAMEEAIKGQSKLLPSTDPTEIAIYYYVDGIPMSAVDDLKGRCLQAFLKRRQQWYRQQTSLNGSGPVSSLGSLNQRVGVPVYSGRDAEERVIETGVIHRLYEVKGVEVGDFNPNDIPELNPPKPANQQENRTNGQAHSGNHQTQTNSASGQNTSSVGQTHSGNHQTQTNSASGQDTSSVGQAYSGGYQAQTNSASGQDTSSVQGNQTAQDNRANRAEPDAQYNPNQSTL